MLLYLLADTSHRARVCRNINRFHTEPSGGFCFFLLCSLSISPRASSLIKPCAASVQLRSGEQNEDPAVDNLVPWLMPRRQTPFGFKAVREKYFAKKRMRSIKLIFTCQMIAKLWRVILGMVAQQTPGDKHTDSWLVTFGTWKSFCASRETKESFEKCPTNTTDSYNGISTTLGKFLARNLKTERNELGS